MARQGNFVRLGAAIFADLTRSEERTKINLGEHAESAYPCYWTVYGESNGQLDLPRWSETAAEAEAPNEAPTNSAANSLGP
jgi:hypothetical protein